MLGFIANIQGKFDLIVLFSISNMNQFFSFWKQTLTKYRFLFSKCSYYVFTRTHHLPVSYLLEEYNITQRLEHELVDGGAKN